jgi:hypothetical protein
MSYLLEVTAAREWVDSAILRHSNGIYGKLIPAVVWTDERGEDGELIIPTDPIELVTNINTGSFILLENHDPGNPKGQVLESAYFEDQSGSKFVAAIFGYYAGGSVLEFSQLGLDIALQPLPKTLPLLPDNAWIEFAFDSREIDSLWVEQVTRNVPIRLKFTELSHNTADVTHELLRIGIGYLAIVWNPLVTSIANEAGKRIYAELHEWIRNLLSKLADMRNPILEVSSFQNDCQVSFLLRGRDVELHYAAHDALAEAGVQAAQLIKTLNSQGNPVRQLTYEWDKKALRWYPSFAILEDNKIIVDSITLIAIEKIPSGLSLGIRKGKSLTSVVSKSTEVNEE